MAFTLNKVMLIGNLGRDSENRVTSNDVSVTTFSLATTHSIKRDSGWENTTTWHNIVAFGLSDFYKDALKKGSKVYVEGRISKREYIDKENIKRYITEIIAEKIIPLDKKETDSFLEGNKLSNEMENSGTEISPNIESQVSDDEDLPF
ncbi:MAG: hypothetical protein STSR0008_08030 [Ignavibacterium sp.]